MNGIGALNCALAAVEENTEQNKLFPLRFCIDAVLSNSSQIGSNPILAARFKKILERPESESLDQDKVQKVVRLLDEGPLKNTTRSLEHLFHQPPHIQEAFSYRTLSGYKLKDLNPFQILEICGFAIENDDPELFSKTVEQICGNSFGMRLVGGKVVIDPMLLPILLEKTHRGSFLRQHCKGIILSTGFSLSLLEFFLPDSLKKLIIFLHIESYGTASQNLEQSVPKIYKIFPHIEYLVFSKDSIKNVCTQLKTVQSLIPSIRGIILDRVRWQQEYFSYYHRLTQDDQQLLKKYYITLHHADIEGANGKEQVREMMNLPDEPIWENLSTESLPIKIDEDEIDSVELRDRQFNNNLTVYFLPEISSAVDNGNEALLMTILDNSLSTSSFLDKEFLSWLLIEAERCLCAGTLSRDFIKRLIGNIRSAYGNNNHVIKAWYPRACKGVIMSNTNEVVDMPLLCLRAQSSFANQLHILIEDVNFCFSKEVLEALAQWLEYENLITVTDQNFLDLDLLATKLGLSDIWTFYNKNSYQSLQESQIPTLLARRSAEEAAQLVSRAERGTLRTREEGVYLDPENLIKIVKNLSPWFKYIEPQIKGMVCTYRNEIDYYLSLLTTPEALEYIRNIWFANLSDLSICINLIEGLPRLEKIIISNCHSIKHVELAALSNITKPVTIQMENFSLHCNEGESWKDVGIREDICVEFKDVKVLMQNSPIPIETYTAGTKVRVI